MANLVPVDHDPFAGDEAAMMPETYVNPMVKATIEHMATLPQRAIEGAAMYQPGSGEIPQETIGTALESAMLPMGTGAVAGLPVRAGETVLGAGPIRAYHGSPHDFDAFDLSKIGTGEGAQAYGHGLYLAGNEAVAKSYKAAGPAANAQYDAINQRLSQLAKEMDTNSSGYRNFKDKELGTKQSAEYDVLMNKKANLGNMYEVNINADPEHFLDWDKPLSQQPQHIQDFVHNQSANLPSDALGPRRGGKHILQSLIEQDAPGGEIYSRLGYKQGVFPEIGVPDKPRISESLQQAGIPGIKYLDQGSRMNPAVLPNNPMANEARQFLEQSKGNPDQALKAFNASAPHERWATTERDEIRKVIEQAAQPMTSNYVVFNDKLIDILRKYGIAGLPAAGAATNAIQAQPSPEDVVNAIRGHGGG